MKGAETQACERIVSIRLGRKTPSLRARLFPRQAGG